MIDPNIEPTKTGSFDRTVLTPKAENFGVGAETKSPEMETGEKQETESGEPTNSSVSENQNKPGSAFGNFFKRSKPTMPLARDPIAKRIEKIMEEDLSDAYNRLSPVAKQEFKLKGEETMRKVRELLRDTHIKVKKILELIFNWLKMLPGINHFFLEQEAKIKTDKIIALKNNQLK